MSKSEGGTEPAHGSQRSRRPHSSRSSAPRPLDLRRRTKLKPGLSFVQPFAKDTGRGPSEWDETFSKALPHGVLRAPRAGSNPETKRRIPGEFRSGRPGLGANGFARLSLPPG